MRRRMVRISVIVMLSVAVVGVGAEEMELDPLLELLVEQGVITIEQALAVQAEYDRRRAAGQPSAVVPQQPDLAKPSAPPLMVEAPFPEETKEEKWYDRIDFKGDLRLRAEFFKVEGISPTNHRDRFRARIRPGIYTNVTDWMEVGLQLRSGDPLDPVSDNSSFDGGFGLIPISISEVFAAFHPNDWLGLTVGKFDAKKKWVVSDMQWDDDVTVEGAMEEFRFGPLKANLYQYILEEAKDKKDAHLLGGQVYGKFGSDSVGSFKVGMGYDSWRRPQLVADLTLNGELHGNRVTNLLDDEGQLISDFQIVNGFFSWSWTKNERWPITFYAFGYSNTGAMGLGKEYDTGYFLRFQVGDYKKKGQMMFRASRYYSEPDALFYVFAQSDTTMASDVDGYRFDLRLGWVMRSYFNFTWYHTEPASDLVDIPVMDRLQVDYIIVF